MPKVFEINGYHFFFFSNEGDPRENCHVHVRKGNGLAKFWLEPEIRLADSVGFSTRELSFLENEVRINRKLIEEVWNEFFR